MMKTIFSAILLLTTIYCAPMMEETWTVTTPEGPVTIRHYDPARELLFGLYCASLINPSKTQYYYPVIGPYLSGYSYCPPDIWAGWSPLQKSLWIQSGIESELRDYEYKLQEIYDMQTFQTKLDAQSLIHDIERAKEEAEDELERKKEEAEDAADELEDAAYDAKLELKKAARRAEFELEGAADNARVERPLAEDATPGLPVFSEKKEISREMTVLSAPGEDQVEVTECLGPSDEKKFVSVGVDYVKRARGLYFSVERAILGPDDPSNLLYSGEIVVYGRRWPPKPAIDGDTVFWTKYFQSNEKEKEEMRATTRMDKGILVSPSGKRLFEEKEVSRIVKNGLANAIKEIIDELGAKED